MDDHRFDALTRGIERRGLLGALLLAAGWGGFATFAPGAQAGGGFCPEKPKGGRCRNDGQCCSGRCKKKKGKRKGKCLCSPLQVRCSSSNDCCPPKMLNAVDPSCDLRGDALERTCCMGSQGHCSEDADCCGIAGCVGPPGARQCLN
jgi:hypothetical protein